MEKSSKKPRITISKKTAEQFMTHREVQVGEKIYKIYFDYFPVPERTVKPCHCCGKTNTEKNKNREDEIWEIKTWEVYQKIEDTATTLEVSIRSKIGKKAIMILRKNLEGAFCDKCWIVTFSHAVLLR